MNLESLYTKTIFFITVFEKCEQNDLGYPDIGASRCVGYRPVFEDALDVVKQNMCDIWEYSYDYACIEEIGPELYPIPRKRWFYKYNKEINGYTEIDEPICFWLNSNLGTIG